MRLLRVSARNFRTWERLDFRVPEGVAAIVGENGAGKSSILAAFEQALFGGRGELARFLTRGSGEETVEVAAEFEHRGRLYRVRRQAGAKPRLDFELEENGSNPERLAGSFISLGRETMAATQELIEETLGFSREGFRASALLMQGDGAAFTEAAPAKRKELLFEALGLGRFEALRAKAAADRKAAEEEVRDLSAQLERARAGLVSLPDVEQAFRETRGRAEELRRRLREREAEAARLAEKVGEAQAAVARAQAASDAARMAQQELARLEEMGGRIAAEAEARAAALASEPKLREAVAKRPLLEEQAARRERLGELAEREAAATRETQRLASAGEEITARAEEAFEAAAALQAELDRLAAEEEPLCPTCRQTLAGAAREAALASGRGRLREAEERHGSLVEKAAELAAEAKAAEERLREARAQTQEELGALAASTEELGGLSLADVGAAEARLAQFALWEQERPSLEEQAQSLRWRAEEIRADRALLEPSAGPSEQEVRELLAANGEAQRSLAIARDELEGKVAAQAGLSERLSGLVALLEEQRRWEGDLGRARKDLALFVLLERAFGRNGIPALILETRAVPQLEAEANRIIADLGRSLRFELRTQRELRGGGQAESLDIAVLTPSGEALYEDFSGGEKTRLDLALRISLARLLARSRAAEVGLLAIDEPSFLDEAGFARLAEVLRGLEAEFPSILVVSHVPALRDAFDATVVVSGGADTGEPSHLEVA